MLFSLNGILKRLLVLGILMSTLLCASSGQAITPRQLVEVVDLGNIVVSPDGQRVAFRLEHGVIERNVVDSAWYVQDIDGTSPALRVSDGGFVVHAFYGLPASAPAIWSPDGRWIYYRAMIDERIDVWRAAADGSGALPVTLDDADVREFSLSDDGRVLKYSVGATRAQESAAEQGEYDQGVRISTSVPIGQPLFRSGYLDGRLSTQRYRGGKELARASLLSDVADHWKEVDLITGARRNDTAPKAPSESTIASTLPRGEGEPIDLVVDPRSGRIALLTRSGDGEGLYRKPYAELAVLPDRKARKPLSCQAEPCRNKSITSVQWRPDSDEVLFTVTDPENGLAQSIFRWNVETGAVYPVVRSRGLINGGRDERHPCGLSARVLVCVVAEADRPPRLEMIDIETGQRRVLFDPNLALASRMAATPAQLLHWKDANGHPFTGQFFAALPRDGRPSPLFVNYYQCSGFVRGGTGDEWPLASLAERGISALCINNALPRIDAVERYDQGLSAVNSAVDLLASTGEIDRNRVGMGGLSFGTEVTLWTVVNSDLLTAASISSTFPSPLAYQLRSLYEDTFYPGLRKYWQLGSPEETLDRWQRLSLVFDLEKVHAPILMQLPEHEYLLSLDWAVPLIKDHLAELHVFPDEAHFKFQPRHKLAAYERNLDWFRFWLQGFEDDDPRKAEQYKQWRAMREHQCERKAGEDDTLAWYCRPG